MARNRGRTMAQLLPEEAVRSIVGKAIAPASLPPTRRFELHYIRGFNDENQVVFAPEFVYLLEAGLPAVAGVVLEFKLDGLGATNFPDFSSFELVSIRGQSDEEIIFPARAGTLVIEVREGTSQATVKAGLAPFVKNVSQTGPMNYFAQVQSFSEQIVSDRIVALPFVTSVELNRIVRIIDGVHWRRTLLI